ncbi:PREDICTED: importin subunit alpha-5-like [Camelina sativa]|uniref:Importin subunit alpha n=1 Tax=Camelina sativa TaxID=90675 RepID=A0ABM0X8C2_CAMSA|nr:PREDICTED: importin subunit alpha-5-like [Camelina sativa]
MSLRPSAKTEIRRTRYKLSVDAEEGRRRREDFLVEIRKNKREESLMKRRRDGVKDLSPDHDEPFQSLLEVSDMIAGVFSDDPSLQLESTTRFRRVLSLERTPPIDSVIKCGVVPRFVEFLKKDDYPRIQFEAAWALTNIASGTSEHTKVVIDLGAVPLFVQLLASPDDDVREQALWGLGNVAGDSVHCRDFVLNFGALTPLLHQLNKNATLPILRVATWTLSNFFRGKPLPPFDLVKPALPALERLVHSNDEEVLVDACWALSNLSDGSNEKIQGLIEAGVVPRLVELIKHLSPFVLIPALRTIGNIASGNHQQTQCVIKCGVVPVLADLIRQNHTKGIMREACWTISNITAGIGDQIQSVIDANLIPRLVSLAPKAEFDIKKEVVWALSNASVCGSPNQIKYLVEQGCIKPLCDILVCPDLRIISVSLDGLEKILNAGEVEKKKTGDVNSYCQMIEDEEGLEKIENLQHHDNNEIYEKAVKILETYWLEEEGEGLVDMLKPQGQGDDVLQTSSSSSHPGFQFEFFSLR